MVLLGKIMEQILVILGLSTKAMKEWRISQSIYAQFFLFIDCSSEKFAKRLRGRTDVDDAFLRIDSLTKDDNIMAVAMTLGVALDIDSITESLQALVRSPHTRVQVRSIDERVESIKEGMQCFLSDFVHTPTISPVLLHNRYR